MYLHIIMFGTNGLLVKLLILLCTKINTCILVGSVLNGALCVGLRLVLVGRARMQRPDGPLAVQLLPCSEVCNVQVLINTYLTHVHAGGVKAIVSICLPVCDSKTAP